MELATVRFYGSAGALCSLMVLALSGLQPVTAAVVAAPAATGSRVLQFPADRSLGMLYVLDASIQREIKGIHYWIDGTDMKWEYLGEATGRVVVPGGKRVRLMLNEKSGSNLSALEKLEADALYELYLGKTADDRCLPHLARLTDLKVLQFPQSYSAQDNLPVFTPQGLKQLGALKSLERLTLPDKITDAGLAAVADALPQLRAVYINDNQLTDAVLAELPKLQLLEELKVGGGKFTNAGLGHLAQLRALHYLLLWGNARSLGERVTDEALLQLRKIPSLKTLVLPETISDAGRAHLADHPTLGNLSLSNLTDRSLLLVKSLPSLKRLSLASITDPEMVHLKELKSLESLSLPGVGLSDTGLVHLAGLSRLKHLGLSMPFYNDPKKYRHPYTENGLKEVAKIRSLESLNIGGIGVTDAALCHVAQLTNLRSLTLFGCDVAEQGLAKVGTLKLLERFRLEARQVAFSGLNQLNGLPRLNELDVRFLVQDGATLSLDRLPRLEYLMLTCATDSTFRDRDLACLAKLKQLKWLQMTSIRTPLTLTDAGMEHLAGLTSLDRLVLGGTGVTDRGLAFLANMRRMDLLRINGDFTDAGLRHLEGCKGLRSLRLESESACSQPAIERLRKALANLQLCTVIP